MEKRVGIKAGCFTILHAGHVFALEFARSQVDYLIVLTNTDDRIMRKKGCVPVSLRDRMKVLRALRCVDEVGYFRQATEEQWVKRFRERRLKREFGEDAKLIVFHDPALSSDPPSRTVADEIVFIPRIRRSVTDIFEVIRSAPQMHSVDPKYLETNFNEEVK